MVAISSSGVFVGSASFASEDLLGGQQSLAVWGDDTGTPELDGALAGEEIHFQLVDGNFLYMMFQTYSYGFFCDIHYKFSSAYC